MTRQVFISHSAGDREAAEAIRAALEAQALSCWIAPRDIPPGAEWAAAIMAGIAEARVVVLVHSAASAASQMVLREVNVAVDSRKPVIPVRIDATLPQDGMQFYLGSTHWLDASAGPLAEQLPRIVAAVADQLGADRPQPGPGAIGAAPHRGPGGGPAPTKRHRVWIGAAVAIVGIVGAAGAWWVMGGPAPPPRPASDTSPAAARASIAVLPFASLGDTDHSDYFADGLTEDIISAVGRFRDISVVSRGGVFTYKGKSPTPAEVGRDLKVRYVVEGSVRRAADRIRVSVSLTDTTRSALLWSDKYDAEPKDIFAVQDQITRRISGALAVQVTSLELARSAVKPPSSLEAYDFVLRGRDMLFRLTRSKNVAARVMFERAIDLDPNYAPAYVGLGYVNLNAVTEGWTQDPSETLELAESLARKAVGLDELDSAPHALLGHILVHFGDYDRALDETKRAIDLNGSDAEAYSGLLSVLLWRGDISGAIAAGETLAQFEPERSEGDSFYLATAYVLADRGADAVRVLESSLDRNRANPEGNIMLAAAYAEAGRGEDAARQADLVRQRFPGAWDQFGALLRDPSQREKLAQALKKAGL